MSKSSLLVLLICLIAFVCSVQVSEEQVVADHPNALSMAEERHSHDKRFLGWSPTQVHLSWTATASEMQVTWVSWWEGSQTKVHYEPVDGSSPKTVVSGQVSTFVDTSSPLDTTRYIHRAVMTGLSAGKRYSYYVVDETYGGTSDKWSFVARRTDAAWAPRYAVYGDFGLLNAESLPLLKSLASNKKIDAIIHDGDFAYDMVDYDGSRGDAWFEQIQPIASEFAYMTSPGNHERADNFTHYRHRFSMPQRGQNGRDSLYWSLDVGSVHFIAIDTEVYYYNTRARQFEMEDWLRKDLDKANQNRAAVPWIIVFGHRPLYASPGSHHDCHLHYPAQRKYLENIFCYGGVDLVIGAHQHIYERFLPVYKGKVYNGTSFSPYYNPPVPAYIISGAAGCQEDISSFTKHPCPYSAFRWPHYGIGVMTIHNNTHLTYDQYDAKAGYGAAPVDTMSLVRTHHRRHTVCY